MEAFQLLIDGQMVAGDGTMPVINPATEETIADCPRASLDQLNQVVAAAKAAFPAWAATAIGERRQLIGQIADVIEQNSSELARLLTPEQGKPVADADAELQGMAGFFRYFATLDLPFRIIEDSAGRKVEAHRWPLGGNDAGAVLDDAKPATVAKGIVEGAFQNSGQVCLAIKRLYVHESIYDEMCSELAQLADAAIVDDGSK